MKCKECNEFEIDEEIVAMNPLIVGLKDTCVWCMLEPKPITGNAKLLMERVKEKYFNEE